MNVLRCTSFEDLASNYLVIKQLYDATFTYEKYCSFLPEMISNGYSQVALYDKEKLIAVSGYWINTKLYTGKYLEIDNFIVDNAHQSKGIGKLLIAEIEKIAQQNKAKAIVLDAFTTNFGAHKFYFNQGYVPKGFHFVKFINE
ncbi:GNAT family N-acetyltransferase [Flavobacterium sp. 20NA77.7]|uniref:GNAT family N-acetyltransferase n=1 Tax=Flavobacterium nakdongensis TaxID=3073563 RepID=A0ABY9RA00_9FLAO|nr:GNAT family N-acetyltransferase [Flavobacterium sp. 20NA77.7]WMW78062.1 GNAT family N-acetyltransferase [Flavobacterium sp. 20NA77.7]